MIADKFIPDDFRTKIKAEIGTEMANKVLAALSEEPESSVRLNSHKPYDGMLYPDMEPVGWCASGYYLQARPSFTQNPLLHAGIFYVQDASSMIYESIAATLSDGKPVKVCDLCAAPGGKTTAILNALPAGSVMLANEFSASRANILKENLSKYGYPEIIVTNSPTERLAPMKGWFDIVAVDAPCSGEGMMRKDETARTQWSEGLVRQCANLQKEILSNAIEMIAPGGYLIYSTCTFNTTEDEDNAGWIASEFGLIPVDTGLAGHNGIQKQVKGDVPCLRFMPGFTRGEGLFVAVFKKPDNNDDSRSYRKATKKGKDKNEVKEKKAPDIMNKAKSWINGEYKILNHDGHLLALTQATENLLDAIPKGVKIIAAGIEIGEIKGKDLIPSHKLAMSVAMNHPFPETELTQKDALRYLAKEVIALPPDTPKGYVTVTYEGQPLGFVKNLGNRSNNLYPIEYRIRNLKIKD